MGNEPFFLNVEMEMHHELDVVHEDLPADVALEGHVRLELCGQHFGLALWTSAIMI